MFILVFATLLAFAAPDAEIARLEAQLKSQPNQMPLRYSLAKRYLNGKEYDKAIETLNPHLDKVHGPGLLILASAYREKKDWAGVVRILTIATSEDDKSASKFYDLGKAQFQNKSEIDAIASMRKSLALDPKFRPAAEALKDHFIETKARYEAREMLQDMLKRFGPQPTYYNQLCQLFAEDGFAKETINSCQKAISVSKAHPDNFVYLAQGYTDSEQPKIAEKVLLKASERFPKSEFVQWATGQIFLKRNLDPVAAKYFRLAVQAKPDSVRSLLGLAEAELHNSKFDIAYDNYFKACQIDPKTVSDFQEATATLRQKNNEAWVRKFNQGASGCRVKR